MAMMAYRATMFLVFFNYSMMIANWLAGYLFPDYAPTFATSGVTVLQGTDIFNSFGSINSIINILLTAGVLALFAFSLLIPTIPFVFLFFGLSSIISAVYLWQLPIPDIFKLPLTMGILIIYYGGITQYSARSSFQGS